VFAGFAFTWADVLIRVNAQLQIEEIWGAVRNVLRFSPDELRARCLTALFDDSQRAEVASIAQLEPGARCTLTGMHLKSGGELGCGISISALRLVEDADVLCVALRAFPHSQSTIRVQQRSEVQAEELETFGWNLCEQVTRGHASGVGVLVLPGLDALKGRLVSREANRLGDMLQSAVREAAGSDVAIRLTEDAYAYAEGSAETSMIVSEAVSAATRAVDPDGRGISPAVGRTNVTSQLRDQDLVNGLVCSLRQFCITHTDAASLEALASNFDRLVSEGVANVRAFTNVVSQGNFTVAFQPIVDVRRGKIQHFEALCRFEDGEAPVQHLQFAEQAGLIHQFDLAMTKKVLNWLAKQPRNRGDIRVAVNISGHSLGRVDFMAGLRRLLDDCPWSAGRLLFEITETSQIFEPGRANACIQELRDRKHPVCIDDFGAGAASFQYLADLQVDIVKFDGKAVKAATETDRGMAFLSALTEFCRRIGVQTVAEMIETPTQFTAVRGCGVDHVQGYLFGRPAPEVSAFKPLPASHLFRHARTGR